ncbi:MAG TPA: hypothetical protein ENK85_02090 [Saprospiraceae bacterium]|nr:hypothetical protein [Saprospiraceae bacterium]
MKSDSPSKSYWLKSGALSMLDLISKLGFGMGSMMILFRLLDKPTVGVWVVFMVITATFIEVPRAGLLQNALLKFLSTEPKEEHGQIIKASFIINLIMTLFIVLFLFFFAGSLEQILHAPMLKSLLWVYMLTTIILIPFFTANYIQQANLDFRGIFLSSFVRYGLFFGYNLLHFIKGDEVHLLDLAKMQLVAAFFGTLVSVVFAKKYFSWVRQLDWAWVKRLLGYGKYVFGTNLATSIHKQSSVLLLGNIMTPAASAMYDVANKISMMIEAPGMAAAGVVFPQSARALKREGIGGVKVLYEKVVGVIVAFLIPFAIFVLIFPKFVIGIIAGAAYYETVSILRITVIFALITPFAVQFGTILDSIGLPKVNFFYTLMGGLLNLVLNYVFIKKFSVIGAAYAVLATYVIMLFFQQLFLRKRVGVQFFSIFKYTIEFYRGLPAMISGILNKHTSTV